MNAETTVAVVRVEEINNLLKCVPSNIRVDTGTDKEAIAAAVQMRSVEGGLMAWFQGRIERVETRRYPY